MSTNAAVNKKTVINTYYRPVIVSGSGRQRALKDRDIDAVAENALMDALQVERPGAEGYILKVFKVEIEKEEK